MNIFGTDKQKGTTPYFLNRLVSEFIISSSGPVEKYEDTNKMVNQFNLKLDDLNIYRIL